MSYLRFEKALMTNLQESLTRELLRTNRSGAYSCSTIVDCNTRKYHGLLVVPVMSSTMTIMSFCHLLIVPLFSMGLSSILDFTSIRETYSVRTGTSISVSSL